MIIRKPYAFLLKHFKLIHLLLMSMILYIIYRTGMISSFFSHYFSSGENVMGQEITDSLFNVFTYTLIVMVILCSIVVLYLMYTKKKPVKYYAFTVLIYIVLFVFMNVTENIINQMEALQLSARTVKAFSDINTIMLVLQILCFLPALVRGIGFNIKQFDFDKDLQELNITAEDREEVEIGFGIDIDRFKRNFNRNVRHMKYAYLENKLFANVGIVILILLMGYGIYRTLGFNEIKYNQGQYFNTSNFIMTITDSYIVDSDVQQKKLDAGKTLIILRIKIKNKYTTPIIFEKIRAELNVGGYKFYPTQEYQNEIVDFGTLYATQKINNDEQNFVLCYEVPANYLDKKIQFHYVDRINSIQKKVETTYVKTIITPIDLRGKVQERHSKLGEEVAFKNPILGKSTLKITNYDIKSEYQLVYNFCVKSGQCQQSFEYIKPGILTNYDKKLLKVVYDYKPSENWNNNYSDFYKLIEYLGTIRYEIEGQIKTQQLEFKQVKPQKSSSENVIYIEVLSEIDKAEKIYLDFNIRNQKYVYELK